VTVGSYKIYPFERTYILCWPITSICTSLLVVFIFVTTKLSHPLIRSCLFFGRASSTSPVVGMPALSPTMVKSLNFCLSYSLCSTIVFVLATYFCIHIQMDDNKSRQIYKTYTSNIVWIHWHLKTNTILIHLTCFSSENGIIKLYVIAYIDWWCDMRNRKW
jgi:hypothetical protein